MTSPVTARTRVGPVVAQRAAELQAKYRNGVPSAIAMLARLRKAVHAVPGDRIDVLEYTLSDAFDSRGDEPSVDEWAAHVAMTLFALHQQSKSDPMHRQGQGLGKAMRALRPPGGDMPEPLRRRFQVLSTAEDFRELTEHLRGVVRLLRSGGVSLDYGALADDLVWWQRPGGPARVRLRWGREFHRTERANADSATTTDTD